MSISFQLAACVAVLIFGVFISRNGLRSCLNGLISPILDLYLSSKFSIKDVEGQSDIPSATYRFPNGQGDAAKFLHGQANSSLWEKKYGPIYRIWSGMTPEIVVTRPEHIHEVFKDSDKHIKAANNDSGYFLGELLGKCVGLVSKAEWKKLRQVTEQAFVRSNAINYGPIVRKRIETHFGELQADSGLARSIIDPAQDLKILPFLIVAEIIYGPLSEAMEKELRDLAPFREKLWQNVMKGGLTRFIWSKHLFFTKANRDLQAFKARWARFNREARDRAARIGDTSSPLPIIAMFNAVESGIVREESILQTLDESLFANLDVTLGGISWNLVFLAAYPGVQDRLRSEVTAARIRASSSHDNKEGPQTEAEAAFDRDYLFSSSSYLSACISESSRIRPLAAFSVPQAAPTPRVVGGYLFPAGTNFIVDSYALNQRNPYWGPDGDKYRPERFLAEGSRVGEGRGGSSGNGAVSKARYNFWRFGFGPRQCMGKYVADLIIRGLLVYLVENYTLSLMETEMKKDGAEINKAKWERDPETWIEHPLMKLRCEVRL
ncbi:cytochrome p450 monooxygenase GliC [Jackrogersella minutella]|nr:cytochrome p450 monooxygenase GliC [Jackrogersella minutella]